MNKQALIQHISQNIIKARRDILSDKELKYIATQIHNLSDDFLKNKSANNIISILTEILQQDLKKQKAKHPEPVDIDVHELLKDELGDHPDTISTDLPPESKDAVNSLENVDNTRIVSIFGTNEPLKIQNIFNPNAMNKKAYLVFDRRYTSRYYDNLSLFQWDIGTQGNSLKSNKIIGTTAPMKDIVKIKMFPFKFPNCDNTLTAVNSLTAVIEEINLQSYSAVDYSRKFHFMFDMSRTGSIGSNAPYNVEDVGNSVTEFEFYKPIMDLTLVSMTFGSPFRRIYLDPDLLPATISIVGIQTVLNFSQPHFCVVGDIFYISGFNTTNPTADYMQIQQMNSTLGWPATAITSTTVTIDVNLSTLAGIILGSPFQIYLEAKRFIIRVEFTFRRYLE